MPANYSNKALHLYLPTATSCLSFLSPVSLLGAALPFPSPPLLLSSPPVSPSLPLSPYGTHYKRCRFSPPTFLRAFHHSLTLHQPCAPLSLFTLFFIVSLSFVISLLVFFLTFQHPVTLFYFLTCRQHVCDFSLLGQQNIHCALVLTHLLNFTDLHMFKLKPALLALFWPPPTPTGIARSPCQCILSRASNTGLLSCAPLTLVARCGSV